MRRIQVHELSFFFFYLVRRKMQPGTYTITVICPPYLDDADRVRFGVAWYTQMVVDAPGA